MSRPEKGDELEGYCKLSKSQVEEVDGDGGRDMDSGDMEEFFYVTTTNSPILPQLGASNRFSFQNAIFLCS